MRRCLPRTFFLIYQLRIRKRKGSHDGPGMKENKLIAGLTFFPLQLLNSLFCFHVIRFNGLGEKTYTQEFYQGF